MINGSNLEHIHTHTNGYSVYIGVSGEILRNNVCSVCLMTKTIVGRTPCTYTGKLGSWIWPSEKGKRNLDREREIKTHLHWNYQFQLKYFYWHDCITYIIAKAIF